MLASESVGARVAPLNPLQYSQLEPLDLDLAIQAGDIRMNTVFDVDPVDSAMDVSAPSLLRDAITDLDSDPGVFEAGIVRHESDKESDPFQSSKSVMVKKHAANKTRAAAQVRHHVCYVNR